MNLKVYHGIENYDYEYDTYSSFPFRQQIHLRSIFVLIVSDYHIFFEKDFLFQ